MDEFKYRRKGMGVSPEVIHARRVGVHTPRLPWQATAAVVHLADENVLLD
jgi:hypothetical protein